MDLLKASSIAEKIVEKLSPFCEKIAIGGSIRREKSNVKDIEIICIPKKRGNSQIRDNKWVMAVYDLGVIKKGKLKDGKYLKIQLPDGIVLDLFVALPENWGMIYLIRTGSANFSKRILGEFKKRGFESKGGFPTKFTARLSFSTELQIFDYLNMDFIEPKYRF